MCRWIAVVGVIALGLVALDSAEAYGTRDLQSHSGSDEDRACPVTAPAPRVGGQGQVGDDSLWALTPNDGVEVADELGDGGYHLALTWVTGVRSRPKFAAKRLDGRGQATIYDPLGVKRSIGLHSIDLVLSELGCWRITGTWRSTRVGVVLNVVPSNEVVEAWQGGTCPITQPKNVEQGFGTDVLRVTVPIDGSYAAPAAPSGGWNLKIPWYRAHEGRLRVRVERLDGPGNGTVEFHESSYPPTGTLPTRVIVSDLGCWRITGSLLDERVSAIIRVKDAGSGPAG